VFVPYEEIGRRIKKARETQGLSQAALARMVKMARTSISNIEAGRQGMAVDTLYNLADALEIEAADLLPKRANRHASTDTSAIERELKHEEAKVKTWVTGFVPAQQEGQNG
jgi:transcriptional regulator with XRE-family HTH domain